MPLIPDDVIDEVQTRADIVELIGRYVPLKRSGRHFKANCPFHKEKTPSFMVNTDKQIFHCFGCGVGGNIFSFLMRYDRLTFPEAVRHLADHIGVPVPEHDRSDAQDELRNRLAALMEQACRYFERTFLSPRLGQAARAYVEQRGVSEPTRGLFRIGLASGGWSRLLSAAKATGVSVEHLEAAGLVVRGSARVYDRFRHRLMFPIVDLRGRVLGFGGRGLDAQQEPKYLNSPETPLYSKGRHLFGFAQAKESILRERLAIVVEGYFDCVVLAGAGLSHVVSPLGTALTADQARLLKRYAERVVLAFDADAAGEQATLRGIDVLVETGLSVHVAQLPSGVDPDEYLRAHGREAFDALIAQSVGILEFLIEAALRRYPGGGTEEKVNAAQFVLPTIAKVPNAMLRSEYVRVLAQRLHLAEEAVAQELANVKPRLPAALKQPQAPLRAGQGLTTPMSRTPAAGTVPGAERLLTALVLDDPGRWEQARSSVSLEEIADPRLQRILVVVGELVSAQREATPAQVISRLSDDPSTRATAFPRHGSGQAGRGLAQDSAPSLGSRPRDPDRGIPSVSEGRTEEMVPPRQGEVGLHGQEALVAELVELARSIASKDEAFEECLRRLRANRRRRHFAQLREQLDTAQAAGQEAEVQRLLVAYQEQLKGG